MSRIITALDFAEIGQARELVDRLDPSLTRLKVGNQLFTLAGPGFIEECQKRDFEIFLDLKFHDIPNTVASALSAARDLGIWMVNVHAGGGPAMLKAARRAIEPFQSAIGNQSGTRLIGVTVLTSMDASELTATGCGDEPSVQVERLAKISADAGLDGVVCSPHEVGIIRRAVKRSFLTVTPGVRFDSGTSKETANPISSHGNQPDDQKRTLSPYDAILAGSDYLVIGRPITQAQSPVDVLHALNAEVQIAAAQLSKSSTTSSPG